MMDRSGWCLKLPVSDWNRAAHDGCRKNFADRSCACLCGHKGEQAKDTSGTDVAPVTEKRTRVPKPVDTDSGT